MVFVETGFIVLSFLPGDSLLFTVGLLTATGSVPFPIFVTCAVIFVAAFAGDQLAYGIGRKAGPAVFAREQNRFFNPKNVERTNAFFAKHGGKAVITARFLPIFRAFVPLAAGVGRMSYRTFVTFNLIGAFAWGVGLTLVGSSWARSRSSPTTPSTSSSVSCCSRASRCSPSCTGPAGRLCARAATVRCRSPRFPTTCASTEPGEPAVGVPNAEIATLRPLTGHPAMPRARGGGWC